MSDCHNLIALEMYGNANVARQKEKAMSRHLGKKEMSVLDFSFCLEFCKTKTTQMNEAES